MQTFKCWNLTVERPCPFYKNVSGMKNSHFFPMLSFVRIFQATILLDLGIKAHEILREFKILNALDEFWKYYTEQRNPSHKNTYYIILFM